MKTLALTVALMALAACGGPSTDSQPTSAPVTQGGANPSPSFDAFRQSQGLRTLPVDARLNAAARAHALDMVANGYFAHESPSGSKVGDRVRRAGYKWCYVAENIAQGQDSDAEVIGDWAGSAGHRANMVSTRAAAYGLYEGPNNTWVMVLAAPC